MLKIKTNINKKIKIYFNNNFLFFKINPFKIYKFFNLNLKFIGKTYKWFLIKDVFFLKFNRKNKTNLFFLNKLRFIKKSKLKKKIFLLTQNELYFFHKYIYFTRRYNIFTQRGLKLSKFKVFKKKGKISMYR